MIGNHADPVHQHDYADANYQNDWDPCCGVGRSSKYLEFMLIGEIKLIGFLESTWIWVILKWPGFTRIRRCLNSPLQ